MKKLKFIVFINLIFVTIIFSQTTKEELFSDYRYISGVYQPYIYEESKQTIPPKDFKAFYISHYGRHGSRYLEPEERYTNPYKILKSAFSENKLTNLGKSLFERVKIIVLDAENRYGDLTNLGQEEHKEIAERMFKSFPEIFDPTKNKCEIYIYSRATVVPRCILSMAANNERLKKLNPKINY